jgi:uncharacterized protein YjdB
MVGTDSTARRLPALGFRSRVALARIVTTTSIAVATACGGSADAVRAPVASVVLTPQAVVVQAGEDAPVSAQARDADDRALVGRVVFWSVNDTSIATVSAAGVVRGRAPGVARVAASVEGRSAVAPVTVLPRSVAAIEVTPSSVQIQVGASRALAARALDAVGSSLPGRTVAWTTSDAAVARVDAQGVVTGVAPGAATVTASVDGRSGSAAVLVVSVPVASVSVAPGLDTLVVGESVQLAATPRDASGAALAGRAVGWASSDNLVATVSSSGLVTAVTTGTATVTATSEGRTGSASIVVLARPVATVTVTPQNPVVEVGATAQLTTRLADVAGNVLTGRVITYTSDNLAVATVSASGLVTGVSAGSATIVARSEGRTGTTTVLVTPQPVAAVRITPPTATLAPGATVQLDAIATSASGAVLTGRAVTWIGAPGVATVSPTGLVTAVAPGTGVIFAQVGGVVGSATITVRAPTASAAPAAGEVRYIGPAAPGARRERTTTPEEE